MPYAYATGETRAWTTRDERELKAEHKRATRATLKHLEELKSKAAAKAEKERPSGTVDKSFMDRLFRRRNTGEPQSRAPSHEADSAGSPDAKRPFPLKPGKSQEPQMNSLCGRVRRKSEKESASCRRARERALHHLENNHDIRRFAVLDRPNAPPLQLQPGTWIPGQINVVDFGREVIAADRRVDLDSDQSDGPTTPELINRFPKAPRSLPLAKRPPLMPLPNPTTIAPVYRQLPPTRPLNIVPRRQYQHIRDIPIPPIPTQQDQSNRDSFFELRRQRSYGA
ncbi:hypothetical protein RhiXN_05395 [Rhizoctonia solani]|uniref:Uncharacterized protein n=1 Tax=Rhizoctonia solani TaxID=456999 RepID=A0A8H8NS77_9AGAM|nr:uncharacterized protein RhiXN_05395 [Rhizoctonia solani]QRW17393.1 hypothetical protein RhiXN_05395 [Rhizoctonia solani]